jgi:hypothetical protein
MNEKIKALYEQALRPNGSDGIAGSYTELDADLFARLIIKACADFIDSHEQVDRWGESYEVVEGVELEKHFGIDEEVYRCPSCGIEDPSTSCGLPHCGLITGGYDE